MHSGIEVVPFGDYADPRKVMELAAAAEEAGWEGLCLWDHVLMPYGNGDPWVILTAVAVVTSRLKLLPAVAAVPRYPPHLLARTLVGLDRLSQGRAVLGAGLGAIDDEFARFGGPGSLRERAEMLDESLEIMTGLWLGGEVTFHGKHYTVDGAMLRPQPVQLPRIPVWIGGASRAALRRAARWDGWIMGTIDEQMNVTFPPEKVAESLEYIQQHRTATAPFELAVDGATKAGETELPAAYEKAGATWWFEAIFQTRGSHAEMLDRIKAGPPRPQQA